MKRLCGKRTLASARSDVLPFGSHRCWREDGVVSGTKVKRCLRCGVVDGRGGKGVKVVVVWLWTFGNDVGGGDLVVRVWLVQNNDRNRKMATSKGRSPVNTKNSL